MKIQHSTWHRKTRQVNVRKAQKSVSKAMARHRFSGSCLHAHIKSLRVKVRYTPFNLRSVHHPSRFRIKSISSMHNAAVVPLFRTTYQPTIQSNMSFMFRLIIRAAMRYAVTVSHLGATSSAINLRSLVN